MFSFGYFSPVNRPLEIALAFISNRSALFPCRVHNGSLFSRYRSGMFDLFPLARGSFPVHLLPVLSLSCLRLLPDRQDVSHRVRITCRDALCPQETIKGIKRGSDLLQTFSCGSVSLATNSENVEV